jgi:hypothetical protein
LVTDRIYNDWSCHLVTILFFQLPGPRSAVTDRMKDEVQRVIGRTDPTIMPPRRFKAFPSLARLGLATVPALVVHCQEGIRPG